ncbi:pentapeptide repeat-containing protein [Nostoc sp. CHAB 5784]|uniref:pentapeptide repeat-containing protein n=1 Tax=Nostoc mirabile TaxID=2907820 RepID=UPI001E34B795|nr:pentapeptide repeat-containing protein [Nostoc mirabile]MCC5667815.1 pentapeptide repeat-containing protein [Nostoc mirabile CHAB5784]
MPQDFSAKKLRGRNFARQDLTGANFSHADIRGADFTNAILRGANFRGAKTGLQQRWSLTRLFFLLFLSLTVMDLTKFFYYNSFSDFPLNVSSWIDFVFLIAPAFIFYTVLFFTIIKQGFTVQWFRRVLKVIASIYAVKYLLSTTINLGPIRLGIPLLGDVNLASVVIAVTSIIVHATMIVVLVAIIGVNQAIVIGVCLIEIAVFVTFINFQLWANNHVQISLAILLNNPLLLFNIFLSALIILVSGYIGWLALNGNERFKVIRTLGMIISSIGGTNFHGADLTEANFLGALLRNTDFDEANLTRTCWFKASKIDFVIPGETYLKFASVRNLVTTLEGTSQDFARKDLRGINLKGAKLQNANFIDTDLSQADIRDADLSGAILVHTRLEQADLTGANLTGACIQDWVVTRTTKLEDVKCDYVFLKYVNGGKRDQMPPRDNFKPGEFTIFVKNVLDTIDLYHDPNINPRVALQVIENLSKKYNARLELVGVKRAENAITLIVKSFNSIDEEKFQEEYYDEYNQTLSLNLVDHHQILPHYEKIIEKVTDMVEDVKIRPTNHIEYLDNKGLFVGGNLSSNEVINMPNNSEYNFNNAKFGGGFAGTGGTQIGGTFYDYSLNQNLTEAAAQIQQLLKQLEETNPTTTETEKMIVAAKAADEIKNNPTLKARVIGALKSGGKEAFKEAVDNPLVNVLIAIIEGWQEAQ